jgi:hypothetical protein
MVIFRSEFGAEAGDVSTFAGWGCPPQPGATVREGVGEGDPGDGAAAADGVAAAVVDATGPEVAW